MWQFLVGAVFNARATDGLVLKAIGVHDMLLKLVNFSFLLRYLGLGVFLSSVEQSYFLFGVKVALAD